jgi:hypothetical protein
MNDLHFTILAALLVFCVVLLIIACLLLARAVRLLEGPAVRKTLDVGKSAAPVATASIPATLPQSSSQARSEFDRFLAEDPSRQLLGKNEQAAAYRAWRKANGLTWNAGQG